MTKVKEVKKREKSENNDKSGRKWKNVGKS